MSGRCRNCGRSTRSTHRGHRRTYRRRHRTVFSQMGFWGWVVVAIVVLWALSDMGVIGS